MSLAGSKMTVITERPWIDAERKLLTPGVPLTTFSNGWVTSTSTCSGESPGASVCIVTCGGGKSGKTSNLLRCSTIEVSQSSIMQGKRTTTPPEPKEKQLSAAFIPQEPNALTAPDTPRTPSPP